MRLSERKLPTRPAAPGEVTAAEAEAAELFGSVRLPARPERAVGVGGTFTALAAIALDLGAHESTHGTCLSVGQLDALVTRLAAMTVAETAGLPSLDPDRAPVLLGGAVVAAAAVRAAGLGEIEISEADLLDGIALGLASE